MRDVCKILFVALVWLAFALVVGAQTTADRFADLERYTAQLRLARLDPDPAIVAVPTTEIVHQYEWRLTTKGQYALMRDGKTQIGNWVGDEYHPLTGPAMWGKAAPLPRGVTPPRKAVPVPAVPFVPWPLARTGRAECSGGDEL